MKPATKAEKAHMAAVVALGCIVHRNQGIYGAAAQIHHITRGGRKRNHMAVIPLASQHHLEQDSVFGDAVHNGYKIFAKKYGTEQELLQQVNKLCREMVAS